ncbi:hypothetical protein D1632_12585 [Chryseobacterium nematophagum]|uniref:Uncharacterized protein n=1 Tax=Chryseobacterium nematophagum TaxID=2305228 RepID=A0A3M7L6T3_9FLAO|nr:hypothetical protein [Chryseobacterium nematophagum]RMZ58451.1 hypothetical protein D1632_12585 [Chryseobacterium nematophagum]
MKIMYTYIRLTILMILLPCCSFFAQQANPSSQDHTVLYYFTGKGYVDSGTKKQIIFSEMMIHATHNVSNIALENNNVIIGKSGKYKISLSCEETDSKKQKKVMYSVIVNNKEIPKMSKINTNAEDKYTVMQLKKGDILAFNIMDIQGQISDKNMITNTLKVKVY